MYESCINSITSVLEIGGVIWVVLGLVRLASALREKNGPGLPASIWQISGGSALVFVAVLFRTANFDYRKIVDVLSIAGKLSSVAGVLFFMFGLIMLAESLRNKNAPSLEAGIWQMIGGMLVYYASSILNRIIISIR